ncbi:unnamed protein product [Phytophthora lilii]|uniref:Unnamed protein product n=1 Tax=Phytophthora lilii TaxID=2077276 RepID=A0A9W6TAF3_9STRA|nr:unnamed protein product [Phytophthora lilii]
MVRIKMQMGSNVREQWVYQRGILLIVCFDIEHSLPEQHQISLARMQDSRLVVLQEVSCRYDWLVVVDKVCCVQFTKDVEAVVPGLVNSAEHENILDLDALLADAAHYFSAQREMVR